MTGPYGADMSDAEQGELARDVLIAEAEAIRGMAITADFHRAVQLILDRTGGAAGPGSSRGDGSVITSGVGKSGLIAQKISATLASTGTPSHYVHPIEALHGDLGRIRSGDVLLILSFSGQTQEALALAQAVRERQVPVIAMAAAKHCALGCAATVCLETGRVREACPLGLAPTSSTTAMLALGDALAVCLARRRRFNSDDYAALHPGGSLGAALQEVKEVMRFRVGVNLAAVERSRTVAEALSEAKNCARFNGGRGPGAILVCDADRKLVGIVTDGDIRRLLVDVGDSFLADPIEQVMSARPIVLSANARVRDANELARKHRVDVIPVLGAAGQPLGLIDVQDLVPVSELLAE